MTVNEDLISTYMESHRPVYRIYEPESTMIVLGAGRRNRGDVILEKVSRDSVPLLIRKGGGGTVVLSPGMVVLSLVKEVGSPFHNREYALIINGWVKRVLQSLGVPDIEDRGISDLTIGERKILGASLFRRRLLLFYQSSLLVSNDLSLFERYLAYPSTVPEYRGGRSHESFCTTLHRAGCRISIKEIIPRMEETVSRELPALHHATP